MASMQTGSASQVSGQEPGGKGATPQLEPAEPAARPRPSRARWGAMLLLCLAGLAVSVELTLLHVRIHQDPAYKSFCALSERINCDTVAQSKFSVFLGLPVSVWGIFGYLAMGGLAALGLAGWRRTGLMLALTAIAAFGSGVLGGISWLRISSICLMCLATYAINAVLIVLAFIEARRAGIAAAIDGDLDLLAAHRGRSAVLGVAALALVSATVAAVPPYWKPAVRSGAGPLPHGTTTDGHAWIGAAQPTLTILEYSDYQCPHCRRGHDKLRALVEAHPTQVRVIHRHYPLDQACNPKITRAFHESACRFASMATCAGDQEKFWEANDYLYANGATPDAVEAGAFAKALGLDAARFEACLRDEGKTRVVDDVQSGIAVGVQGTPTLVIDGKISHDLPDDVLARLR